MEQTQREGAEDKQRAVTACSKHELLFGLSNITPGIIPKYFQKAEKYTFRKQVPAPVIPQAQPLGLVAAWGAVGLSPGFSQLNHEPLVTPEAGGSWGSHGTATRLQPAQPQAYSDT